MPCDQVNVSEFTLNGVPVDVQMEAFRRMGYTVTQFGSTAFAATKEGIAIQRDAAGSLTYTNRWGAEFDESEVKRMASRVSIERQAKKMGWSLSNIMGTREQAIAKLNQFRKVGQ